MPGTNTTLVDPADIDSSDGQENFDTQQCQLWLDPDGYEDGLSNADTSDLITELETILSLYPESPPPTQEQKERQKRTWIWLQQLYDKIRRHRGRLWERMNAIHKAAVEAIVKELLDSHPTVGGGGS